MNLLILIPTLFTAVVLFLFGNKIGTKGAAIFAIINMFITVLISLKIFLNILFNGGSTELYLYTWLISDNLKLDFTLFFDSVTSIMLLVINIVSFLVHVYTVDYMKNDPRIISFFATISMFTCFMIILVTSVNFIVMFLAWEGVGVASFLLIRFWRDRLSANKSALKAMIVNRIGDFGLILGIGFCFYVFKSLDFSVIFAVCHLFKNENFYIFSYEINKISLISFFLFIGAMGKSAQIGLHVWLPDAMEGPTPVSALIHAATMVTAGVFLLIRCSPLFEYSEAVLCFITIIGALTAFFGATTGLMQNDLKRVIAYSTCSQLGYMIFACGLSNYSVGLFHLMNHAFFKALLFLSAGSVIHALMDEQDMRKMGGLFKVLPFTYLMILIGSLSLMGFPFLTGFYSKDFILETTYATYSICGTFAYWLGVLSAFFTAFYSFRLLYLTFFSKPNGSKNVILNSHECSNFMLISLIILGIGSIFIGYFFRDLMVGLGTPFFENSIFVLNSHINTYDAEFIPFYIKLIPLIFSIFGMLLSIILYNFFLKNLNFFKKIPLIRQFFNFLQKKWYFDVIYNYFISQLILNFGYEVTFKILDKGFIEILGPLGIIRNLFKISKILNNLNSGYLYHYAFLLILAISIIIFFFFI